MTLISISSFKGKAPRTDSKLLPNEYAEESINCDLQTGKLRPLAGIPDSNTLVGQAGSAVRTVHKLGDTWVSMGEDIYANVVPSTVSTSTRFFWTGDGFPKESDEDSYPNAVRLGIVPPTDPLTITMIDSDTAPEDPEIVDTVSYVYTRVAEWADGGTEESAPSDPTAVIYVYEGQAIILSGFDAGTGNDNIISYFRIYRVVSGTTGAAYQYLDQISALLTTYTDDALTGDYGHELKDTSIETLSTDGWLHPSDDLEGLVQMSGGIVAGFVGKDIYFSETFIPYAFPLAYSMATNYDIVALVPYNGSLLVLTTAYPYVVTGADPESMSMQVMPYEQPCVSARGAVSTPDGVIYPTPDGLFLLTTSSGSLLTTALATRAQWQLSDPEDLIGFYYNDKYYGFYEASDTGFIFNYQQETYAIVTQIAGYKFYGGKIEVSTDKLYVIVQEDASGRYFIADFGGGDDLSYTWKSKMFETVTYINFSCARILGDFGTVTFKLYADGVLKHTQSVTSSDVFRLPGGFRAKEWQFELSGTAQVDGVLLATSPEEITGYVEDETSV